MSRAVDLVSFVSHARHKPALRRETAISLDRNSWDVTSARDCGIEQPAAFLQLAQRLLQFGQGVQRERRDHGGAFARTGGERRGEDRGVGIGPATFGEALLVEPARQE